MRIKKATTDAMAINNNCFPYLLLKSKANAISSLYWEAYILSHPNNSNTK